ncbi:MAG TPA: hypothetical protein VGF67_17085 [Ktedonobacteraceae bacterium]
MQSVKQAMAMTARDFASSFANGQQALLLFLQQRQRPRARPVPGRS